MFCSFLLEINQFAVIIFPQRKAYKFYYSVNGCYAMLRNVNKIDNLILGKSKANFSNSYYVIRQALLFLILQAILKL